MMDNYHEIFISCGGGISYEIKSYAKGCRRMTEEQVTKIADTILAHHQEQRALCNVRCDEIIADYARLMIKIEEASNEMPEDYTEEDVTVEEATFKDEYPKELPWYRQIDWSDVAAGIVAIVIPSIVTATLTRKR